MLSYRDMTFCVSDKCPNKCYRYITNEIITEADNQNFSVAAFFVDGVCSLSLEKKEKC